MESLLLKKICKTVISSDYSAKIIGNDHQYHKNQLHIVILILLHQIKPSHVENYTYAHHDIYLCKEFLFKTTHPILQFFLLTIDKRVILITIFIYILYNIIYLRNLFV